VTVGLYIHSVCNFFCIGLLNYSNISVVINLLHKLQKIKKYVKSSLAVRAGVAKMQLILVQKILAREPYRTE
jgi:hypothetical protein